MATTATASSQAVSRAAQRRQRLLLQQNQMVNSRKYSHRPYYFIFAEEEQSVCANFAPFFSVRSFAFCFSIFYGQVVHCFSGKAGTHLRRTVNALRPNEREKRQCECESMRKIAQKLMNTRIRQQTRTRICILLQRLAAGDAAILRARAYKFN